MEMANRSHHQSVFRFLSPPFAMDSPLIATGERTGETFELFKTFCLQIATRVTRQYDDAEDEEEEG